MWLSIGILSCIPITPDIFFNTVEHLIVDRAVTRTLTGEGGKFIMSCPNWQFEKKSVGQNMNIWIYPPPPIKVLNAAKIADT